MVIEQEKRKKKGWRREDRMLTSKYTSVEAVDQVNGRIGFYLEIYSAMSAVSTRNDILQELPFRHLNINKPFYK